MSRIVVADYAGHPFQAELSRELARRGNEVVHVYCSSYVSGKGVLERTLSDPDSLRFEGLSLQEPFAKHSMRKRFMQEREFGRLIRGVVENVRPNVVISANMPLFAQRVLVDQCARAGIRFVFWLQDVTSVAMGYELKKRLPGLGAVGAKYLYRLERSLLKRSDAVVAITPDFLPLVTSWGIDPEVITVIPNWAPLAEFPVRPKENAWALGHGIGFDFVYLYAGTLGLKHDPALIVDLAAAQPEARVVVVSEGSGADFVRAQAERRTLQNLSILPFQSIGDLPDVLASADVLLVILEAQAGVFSVPSKVLSYLCAARPILASMPPANQAHRLVVSIGAGFASSPGDTSEWLRNAAVLRSDVDLRERMGHSARDYAERTFTISTIADQFERPLGLRNAALKEEQHVAHAA